MASSASSDELVRAIHHVFLPPQLPQQEDDASEIILNIAFKALEALQTLLLPNNPVLAVKNALALLKNLKTVHSRADGNVSESDLRHTLDSLEQGTTMAIKVTAQNSAVLITRQKDQLIFEHFELSPSNEAVFSTKGRLVRTFPSLSIAVDAALLHKEDFNSTISNTLSTMSQQAVPGMRPQTKKAGTYHDEDRDSIRPAIVSELLFGVLRGIGHAHSASTVTKNTREEVLWKDASRPWRRSPMWLLIRVALQIVISRSTDGSRVLYKKVIAYVMSYMLDIAQQVTLPSDLLYTMNAKIDRRRQKLLAIDALEDPICQSIAGVLRTSNDKISTHWTEVQINSTGGVDLEVLAALDFERDTQVALPDLESYIREIDSRQSCGDTNEFKPSSELLTYEIGKLPTLPKSADGAYASPNLQQFEQWVAEHLDQWVATNNPIVACKELCTLIKNYHPIASKLYANNPEGISVMLLTIFELWNACDQAAIRECSLLAKYDHGIPSAVLQNLLLPFLDQMQRLSKIELHKASRTGTLPSTHLFDISSSQNFAKRYFDTSSTHQALLQTITSRAEFTRQAKREELTKLKAKYQKLDTLVQESSCEFSTRVVDDWCDPPEMEQVHKGSCQRCLYEKQRDRLSIEVHEWPLPCDPHEAKVVVFELQVPAWFVHWRDARSFMLHDVLSGKSSQKLLRATYRLSANDPHLSDSHFTTARHRIGLLSENKPFIVSHYGYKVSTCSEADICVNNGLKYQYYDSTSNSYVEELDFDSTMPLACTYKLPIESKALQRFLYRPANNPDGPAPNTVIASQNKCPAHMPLEEYKELSTLPLGHFIQWTNLITQLAMPSVDFRKQETTLFFLQCIYQAGPSFANNVHRETHSIFHDDTKALLIIDKLRMALQRIKQNWESAQALRTLIAVATRVLSLNNAAKNASSQFLMAARDVAVGWIQILRDRAYTVDDYKEQTEFIWKSVEVALICTSIFDVDDHHLASTLQSPENASVLVWASIVCQEGEQTQALKQPRNFLLHLRLKRLLYRSYRLLAINQAGLNLAIKKAWTAYKPGPGGWSPLSNAADHWVTTVTAVSGQTAAMRVYCNLLTGELLANGLPLNQPPAAYHKQSLFQQLFGKATVEVMPASDHGFRFSTKREFGGYEVQLGMDREGLIVRSTSSSGIFESVPSSVLQDNYPRHFLDDYLLWYNTTKDVVEFRPIQDPWNSESASKWTLSRCRQGWRLTKDHTCLLGVNNKTSQALGGIFQPLAKPLHLHCILQNNGSLLQIEIPSLRLGFSLAKGSSSLRSREYRSWVVDQDQNIGTLIGFSNALALKSQSDSSRLVLILESSLGYSRKNGHVLVQVTRRSKSKVHALKVDDSLRRLQNNGDLDCQLYLAYLHALTSFCLPDPFTLHTGTEQALTILRSKAVESFDQLSQANVDRLCAIAGLSPKRRYYPQHERVMQQVDWSDSLSTHSQHGDFSVVATHLLQQSRSAQVLFPDVSLSFPSVDRTQEEMQKYLRERDSIRSSAFRVSGFGAENHSTSHDKVYASRDQAHGSKQCQNVATMASVCFRDDNTLHLPVHSQERLWALMQMQLVVHGHQFEINPAEMQYHAKLLENGFNSAIARFPALHHWLKNLQNTRKHMFAILVWLSTLAFSKDADLTVLQILAMCYKSPHLVSVEGPGAGPFHPQRGQSCQRRLLMNTLIPYRRKFDTCPEYRMSRNKNEIKGAYDKRRQHAWKSSSDAALAKVVDLLVGQWRCAVPTTPTLANAPTYINMASAMTAVQIVFKIWYENGLLHDYLVSVYGAMSRHSSLAARLPMINLQASDAPRNGPIFVSEEDLFSGTVPTLPQACHTLELYVKHKEHSTCPVTTPLLKPFLQKLRSVATQSSYELAYTQDLEESLAALMLKTDVEHSVLETMHTTYTTYLEQCKGRTEKIYGLLVAAMSLAPRTKAAHAVQQSPRISPTFLLKQLARDRWPFLTQEWRKCIVEYALALTALQRAERLLKLSDSSQKEDLVNELRNVGHKNWNPFEHPESLLIEVESGIMIRDVQQEIAEQMRHPSSRKNAVMQLNMGEGKSSVIVPIVAADLANGSQLVRVIVAKPQSKQMAQMLIAKFGGLVSRRVYFMPFSRSLKLTASGAEFISIMLHECMTTGGILLVQPEHILSFKLMAPECYVRKEENIGRSIMATQDFLDSCSRDIVDESDENFSPRFELIYTMGTQRSIELSPHRWFLIEEVLELVRVLVPGIANTLPASIEVTYGIAGSFPRVRILRVDAEELLVATIATHVCNHGLRRVNLSRQSPHIRSAVYTYITKAQLSSVEIDEVESSPMWTNTMQSHLLMLRGLLAGGVLAFTLSQKRWRVNYGLATRTPPTKLAVPYRAKDSPSPRSEFSHPDVVIVLTLLSYYYNKLDDDDLFTALGHLMDSDQPDTEYQEWVKDSCGLSTAFKQLQGINLKDRFQCTSDLFPSLCYGKNIIDYFLSHIVFPKEMKEFPHKLSASGWDIGKSRELLTTGFSGTNDSRQLMPLDMGHLDLLEQKHTNALVLEHLLRPENGVHLMSSATTTTSDTHYLLSSVLRLQPAVQVILDVGAQVLELNNLEMAKAWLKLHDTSKEAVVFVNESDDICVVDREGRVDFLRTSSYQSRLDSCLVYLDEAHTRGIDLKLPQSYRAAVTLGANLTKDRLVQACMRMRKLGKGQTVVFCISQEIQRKISETITKSSAAAIDVADVLAWSIAETHADMRRSMPMWAVQGERFFRQEKLWKECQNQDGQSVLNHNLANKYLEDEAQTIDARYRPRQVQQQPAYLADAKDPGLMRIAARCREFDGLHFNSSTLQEEQERELSPEIEQERQVQRTVPAKPSAHRLHQDVQTFALTGAIVGKSRGYGPAFQSLKQTRAGKLFAVHKLRGDQELLTTTDYDKAVVDTGTSTQSDTFLRPVQWLLTSQAQNSKSVAYIMIISPYEANQLYRLVENSSATFLHVYKPRVNSGYASLDTLDLCRIPNIPDMRYVPRSLVAQLNLFAGQLYLSSYEDYLVTCTFLGLSPNLLTKEMEKQGWKVDTNGFILCDGQGRVGGASGLKKSPVNFFKVLMSTLRNGTDISKTHMGRLLEGKLFQKYDFEA